MTRRPPQSPLFPPTTLSPSPRTRPRPPSATRRARRARFRTDAVGRPPVRRRESSRRGDGTGGSWRRGERRPTRRGPRLVGSASSQEYVAPFVGRAIDGIQHAVQGELVARRRGVHIPLHHGEEIRPLGAVGL